MVWNRCGCYDKRSSMKSSQPYSLRILASRIANLRYCRKWQKSAGKTPANPWRAKRCLVLWSESMEEFVASKDYEGLDKWVGEISLRVL